MGERKQGKIKKERERERIPSDLLFPQFENNEERKIGRQMSRYLPISATSISGRESRFRGGPG